VVADKLGRKKKVRCIRILGGHDRRYASVGDLVVVSVKSAIPGAGVKKAKVVPRRCRSNQKGGRTERRFIHSFLTKKMPVVLIIR